MRVGIDCRMLGRTGIGTYISNLIRCLAGQDFIAFHSGSAPGGDGLGQAFEVRKIRSPIFTIREQWELPRAIAAEDLKVFHSTQLNLPLLSRAAQVTTIYDCRLDRFPQDLPSRSARLYYDAMMWAVTRQSDAILVPSQTTKRDLLKFHPTREDKVHVIPLGVDTEIFSPGPGPETNANDLKGRFGLNEETLLYAGLSYPHKNLRRLMRALRATVNAPSGRWKRLKLVCAGPISPQFPSPSKLASEELVSDSVIETGLVSEETLVGLMRNSTILVQPALAEGFGLTVIEAMACGLPTLLSTTPALRETGGDASMYFDPLKEEDLAEKLQILLDHPEARAQLIQAGYKRIQEFTWEKCARETAQVYENVAANH